jgi:cellulose synthase/poly-beta-1,6-N-acetylglucosamine synthase-like glycosyltransferase
MAVYLIDITILLFIGYGIVLTLAAMAWKKMDLLSIRGSVDDSVSVIIAARNEEKNISRCLSSLLEQDYPFDKMEILVVDDQSDDRTADIVSSFSNRGVRFLQINAGEKGGKKAALSKGIAAARHGIIVATDADCIFPSSWLKTLVGFRKKQDAVFVAAPVMFRKEDNFLERFQSLDFMALQSITAVAVTRKWFNMCNGANLLYTKEAFEKVKGFEGIDGIPTGDDMLLMEKIAAAYPGKVAYCHSKEAVVLTEPMQNWRSFLQQRIRWASKSTAYQSLSIKLVLLMVYLLNLSLLLLVLAGIFYPLLILWGMFLLTGKYLLECMLMQPAAAFYGKEKVMRWFGIAQPVHVVYTVVAAMLGWVRRYEWKGRSVRG